MQIIIFDIKYILIKIYKKSKIIYLMQSQENIQKLFFEQLKPGDFVDARFGDDDWKLAKVIDRENKCISIIYDGCPPNNQQLYINPLRVKPLRAVTFGYTGPVKAVYGSITSIPELFKHTQMITTILKTSQPPSAYKITQYLRGDLFSNINSLLISDIKLSPEQITILNNFLIQLLDQICKICTRVAEYLPQVCDLRITNNHKYLYLVNYKLAFVYSLQQLTYLANLLVSQGNQAPKLLKNYKNEILQQNLINHMKKYLPMLTELCNANDGNGKWLPTYTRLNLSKILLKYKQQQKFFNTSYDVKDYLQYYNYWPAVMAMCPTEQNEKKFIDYILTVMCKQSPFDTKLKSLVMLRKILQKEQKLGVLSIPAVIQMINRKNVVNSLLQYFNPQIFKRYIPILKISSTQAKKTLTQAQVDDIFKIMKTSHESDVNLIYEIIVSISQFITVQTLDNIYIDIEKNIDINSENGVKFVRDFTIKAIQNFNTNKNKGFLSSLIGIKKNSSKFGYYGLDLLCKQISDEKGRILPKNIAFAIHNIGIIFQNEAFHHERLGYMQNCINYIDKKQNYGQSIKLLHEIICTYPSSTYISQSQQSIVGKLDDKYKLIDTFIKGLKPLQKECNGQTSKNINSIKVNFIQSIKYFYDFIQRFNGYLKNKLMLRHINHLWHMPHIFQFLRKAKQLTDSQIPSWKRKYQKKLASQMIKSILTQILKSDQNIIPSQECFQAIHQLILSFNLGKSIQLTERATIRYINLQNIVGTNFYFKFLEKIIAMNKVDWKNKKGQTKNNQLVEKVIKTIFDIHLRPHNHQSTDQKAENWMKCLMKVIKSMYKQNAQICVNSIQTFLQLIKGRQFKDITASGKLDILISFESKQKTVTLPRNSTILKLRNSIMELYKIKWNFTMYNTSLKRDITFIQQQDFSINAMGHAIKGPTIVVKKVQQGQLYPQAQAYELFMNLIQKQQEFYKIVFGLLKKQSDSTLHSRIWKIIEKVPVNQATKSKIKNCKEFSKEDWVKFLLPNRMEQLQYSINIVYSLLTTSKWMQDFKKTKGNIVIQQLFLSMLSSKEPLGQKVKIQLSKILLKIFQHQEKKVNSEQQQGSQKQKIVTQQQNIQNLIKISNKIMQTLYTEATNYQNANNKQYKPSLSIQFLNLMMKMLLVLSIKKNCPDITIIIKYFLNDGILLKISDIILFQPKNTDTTFFTQDILQKITLGQNLQFTYKCQILRQYISKYLDLQILNEKKSTQNYFTFLIDFLHCMDKEQSKKMYESNPQIVKCIKKYVEDVLGCNQLQSRKLGIEKNDGVTEQMAHGCFKLLNQTLNHSIFQYDEQRIFHCLLENFALIQAKSNGKNQQAKSLKTKNKYKKILYDIIKSMIFNNTQLLNIFVEKITPKLQTAEWRRNSYASWNLQQQKKQKKYFCGLENLAATCYINCLFQQLFMIKRFTDRFINIDSLAYKQIPEGNEIYQLQRLLTYLKYGNKRSYTTRQFCQSFITYQGAPIDPTVQNDADEFFNALMQKIQGFLKSSGQHYILQDTFEGKLSNQLNCQGCPHSSQKIQSFLSIGLNIKNKKTLEAAFDGYVQGQILDGDNAYFCEKCQKKVKTMKRMCIKQVPNILVVVLKRFSYNFDQMRKIKINDELKFPQDINIKKYTSQFNLGQQCKPDQYYDYKLRGAVIHAGTSEGGHYYSFIKQQGKQGNSKWFQFNDEIIQQADYKRIQQDGFGGQQKDSQFKSQKYKNAYILFYQKKQMIQKKKSKIEQYSNNQSNNQQMMMYEQQSFQNQLSQVVKSENRNADFLSIILDQLFIRLCQNIAMCGHQKAHHFILLYFHTVLLRDKNKQDEHLANIYRIILTIMNSSPELCVWYLEQIDNNYVKQFIIEAPKLIKYLCLGFLKQAIKVVNQTSNQLQQKIKKTRLAGFKAQIFEEDESQITKISQDDTKTQAKQGNQQPKQQEKQQNSGQSQKKQPEQIKQSEKNQIKLESQKTIPTNQQKLPAQLLLKRYQDVMDNLIRCLIYCIKPKGMTPFAKIFTYLSSIPKYRKILASYSYPQRIVQIVVDFKPKQTPKIQYQPRNTYFGKQNSTGKQKDLQMSYAFLVQSLRYYPGCLEKQIIINLLNQCSSRPATKSLAFLLAKTSKTAQQVLQNIQIFQTKLMNDKYKREDIQKFLFLIRYYFILANTQTKNTRDDKKLVYYQSIKSICINSLTIVIKSNETSYQLMELTVVQLNKLAYSSEDFKKEWAQKVSNNEGLYKSFEYWVSESSRPHFLYRSDEWKKKIVNISYSQKDLLSKQNRQTQEERTNWMLEKKNFRTKKEEQNPLQQFDFNKKQYTDTKVPQIHSQLQITEINKSITVGFKTFKICERLGILTKVIDEKGTSRWAIIERNDIDIYLDF